MTNNDHSLKQQNVSCWTQWLAALHACLMTTLVSLSLGIMSPFLAKLLGPDPPFEVRKEQTTWVASLAYIASLWGAIQAALITIWFGSKRTLHSCGVILMIAAISLKCATSIEVVYLMLICNGICKGLLFGTIPVYIGEISDTKIRGGLITFALDGFIVGHLAGTIMGTYLDYRNIGVVCFVLSGLYLVTFAFFPHTPYYLIRQGKLEEAMKSIEWYNRGVANSVVVQEVDCLLKFTKSKQRLTITEILHKINKPANRKALLLMNIAACTEKLSSLGVISDYLEVLFIEAKISVITPSVLVIIIFVLGAVTSLLAIYTSDRFERRNIVFWACVGIAISFVAWGLRYQLLELGTDGRAMQYLVIISANAYRTCFTMGLMTLMPTIMSEMLAPDIRSIGVCIFIINMAFCLFISAKTFQFLVDTFKYQYVFYLNAVVILFLGIYTKKYLCTQREETCKEAKVNLDDNMADEVQIKLVEPSN